MKVQRDKGVGRACASVCGERRDMPEGMHATAAGVDRAVHLQVEQLAGRSMESLNSLSAR